MLVVMHKKIIKIFVAILIFLPFWPRQLMAEEIRGTVIDSTTREPIRDVNIQIPALKTGATTDKYGHFSFQLKVISDSTQLIFKHIRYRTRTLTIAFVRDNKSIKLEEKDIPFEAIQVTADKQDFEYNLELSSAVSEISSEKFDMKGYSDVADIMRTNNSISISEKFSGKKTVSVRGSTEEDVTILYNGIKINNNFDNLYDLSVIEPSAIGQIDIIKGVSSVGFGTIGDAAVINLIPRKKQDYNLRFQQRIGTYDSGDWDLNLYKNIGSLDVFGSVGQGGAVKTYQLIDSTRHRIEQFSDQRMLNVFYEIPVPESDLKHNFYGGYFNNKRKFDNQLDRENYTTKHQMQNISYKGGINSSWQTRINIIRQLYNEQHEWYQFDRDMERKIQDESLGFDIHQNYISGDFNIYLNYLLENSDLEFENEQFGDSSQFSNIDDNNFSRDKHGISLSTEIIPSSFSLPFSVEKFTLSFQHEIVKDQTPGFNFAQDEVDNHWSQSSYLFTIKSKLYTAHSPLHVNLNYGSSYNIPTLYQRLAYHFYKAPLNQSSQLFMEYKRYLDLNWEYISRPIKNFSFSYKGVVFFNDYENKFRKIYISNSPLRFFDNRKEAHQIGIENNLRLYLYKNLIALDGAYSSYVFSDTSAFSFKPDRKLSLSLSFNSAHFNASITWFKESQRAGHIFTEDDVVELVLPEFSNIDLDLKGQIKFAGFNFICSLSGKNILSDRKVLEGISVQDRRLYLSAGVEW